MNDGQTGKILNDSIEKIKGILSIIAKISTRVDGLEKRISEIEKLNNIYSPKETISDEDKNEVKERNNLDFGNKNQEIELKKENLDLKERLENLKNEKIKEIEEKDQRISELTEKNTELEEKNKKLEEEKNEKIDEIEKISKDLNQEKDNFDNLKIEFSNFKKGAEAEFLRLNGEIKSRDVKINDLNFKINNLLREKAN